MLRGLAAAVLLAQVAVPQFEVATVGTSSGFARGQEAPDQPRPCGILPERSTPLSVPQ
jgi:hypothetical protein